MPPGARDAGRPDRAPGHRTDGAGRGVPRRRIARGARAPQRRSRRRRSDLNAAWCTRRGTSGPRSRTPHRRRRPRRSAPPHCTRCASASTSLSTAPFRSECRLVHATRDVRTALPDTAQTAQAAAFRVAALHAVRERLNVALEGAVPWKALHYADVKEGWAPAVLDDAVRESGAELVILGAKHHTALGRRVGGS